MTGVLPRQPLVGLGLCAAAGIVVAEFSPVPAGWALFLVLATALAAWRWHAAVHAFVFASFLLLHLLGSRDAPGFLLAKQLGVTPRTVAVDGTIIDEPREGVSSRGKKRFDFSLRLERVGLNGSEQESSAIMLVRWLGEQPAYGDRVKLIGAAENLQPIRNPGQFDYAASMQRRGIFSVVAMRSPNDGRITAHRSGSAIYEFALEARHWMERTLSRDLADESEKAGLIRGMVLGSRADSPPDIEDLFRKTGTMHLFAVSGLNVAMFAYIAWGVLKMCGVKRTVATPLLISLVAFYALLTGLTASGVRAAIMTGVLLGGFLADRPALPLNSLGAAICLITLCDTNQLFATGFQLSFAVVLAIFVFARPIRDFTLRIIAPDPFLPPRLFTKLQRLRSRAGSFAADSIGVSVAAWIGSLPLNFHYFHLLSPWTVLANLFVVPLAFCVLAGGTLSLLSFPFSSWLTAVCNNANLAFTCCVMWIVKAFAALPGSGLYMTWPEFAPGRVCTITVLDMGSGAAIHVAAGGKNWMMDCGSDRQYRWTTRGYLQSRGVNGLDGLLLSHGDIEHIGAASSLLKDFGAGTVVDSVLRDRSSSRRAIQSQLANARFGRCLAMRGDTLSISPDVALRVLYPSGEVRTRIADDRAFVLQLTAAGTRVLFVFDSGFFTERWLLEHPTDLRSDIVVKGQHMSDISGTAEFFDAVLPKVAICSAADFPKQARVSESWAKQVESRGIRLFRQDETGAVQIKIERAGFEVGSFLHHQTFRSRSR